MFSGRYGVCARVVIWGCVCVCRSLSVCVSVVYDEYVFVDVCVFLSVSV